MPFIHILLQTTAMWSLQKPHEHKAAAETLEQLSESLQKCDDVKDP